MGPELKISNQLQENLRMIKQLRDVVALKHNSNAVVAWLYDVEDALDFLARFMREKELNKMDQENQFQIKRRIIKPFIDVSALSHNRNRFVTWLCDVEDALGYWDILMHKNELTKMEQEKFDSLSSAFGFFDSLSNMLCAFSSFIISPNGVSKFNISRWEKGGLLGRGSFGAVYEAISCEGYNFAVKEVSLLDQEEQIINQLKQEIVLLSQYEHENIVRYLGTETVDSTLYIFLERATLGSLAKLYKQYHFPDSDVSAYTRQILLALKYLHGENVMHRDIKCANILVASNGTVKLADFGFAKVNKSNDLNSFRGSPFWMAPEVVNLKKEGYGLPADIWSLGCTVLEMLTGVVPYHDFEVAQALFKISTGVPPAIPDRLSSNARDFIQLCLRVNPNDRPTAAELLEHRFLPETT